MYKVLSLVKSDIKGIYRDGIFIMALLAPLLMGGIIRFVFPSLVPLILKTYHIDLIEHFPFILSIILLMIPMTLGMLIGFMLLEDRDEEMLMYYSITPLMKKGYFQYKLVFSMGLTVALTFIVIPLSQLVQLTLLQQLMISGMLMLETPLLALCLASFAGNKVEGLAISKVTSITILIPIVCYFLNTNWRYTAAILPSSWVSYLVVHTNNNMKFFIIALAGILIHLVYLFFFMRVFLKKIA